MAVYFISDGEYIKIGKADNPNKRLDQLQTANARPLVLLHTISGGKIEENKMHHLFKKWHVRGEWFRAESEMLKNIFK